MAGKSTDDEEVGQDEYENDGFIVDDEEEQEDGGHSDEEREKTKKRKKKSRNSQKNYVLDEDDYELLEDNNVTGFRRPKESKKFKRLKKAHVGDEDDMSDFVVEEDLDEQGSPMRRKVTRKQPRPGVSSSALQEAHEIFGNVDDLLKHRKQGLTEMTGYEFEPKVISDKYMTEKDDMIRDTDFPERLQVFEHCTGPPPTTESSIDEESVWICNQLRNMIHLYERIVETSELSIVKEDVLRFLNFIHIEKLDVPFIAMYRKDECPSLFKELEQLEADGLQNSPDKKPELMWHQVLWTILDLDKKWLLFQKRKNALHSYYEKRYAKESIDGATSLFLNHQLFDSISKSSRAAESEREVDDVDLKFNLHFPPGEVGDIDGQYKRPPKRKSNYSHCIKAGLRGLASKFGYSSEQFGLQLSLEKMRMEELLDSKETPEEAASNFICYMFVTPQDVLRGARYMAAVEICCEPYVRKYVRSVYMDNAVVSTCPTTYENDAIDTFDQYATIKWLREKPLAKFMDAQWLLIHKAEEQKLIKVAIKLPDPVLAKLISDSNENYLSDGVSKSAQLWNEQRKLILQDAIFSFLLPSMEKEARSLLASRAKNWLLLEYGKLLWDRVCVAPYRRKEHNPSSDEETAPTVMACCWGPGKPATTFVMLDSSGEVLDTLYAGSICNRGQSVNDRQRKKNDQQRVLKFMTEHQPHVVVLGAANLSCRRLKEDIFEIIVKMKETSKNSSHKMDSPNIFYGDEALPHIYENSRISSDQLPSQPGIVKRAVALGRYLQNPLAMAATLCGPGKEILSWKLSPLDDFLTSDEKFGMIEQIMVDVTNQVGLDINLALSHEWLFSTMQFISGLGPRKAASLMRSLVRSGAIFTRKDLLTEHGIGKKVFINSVGFLRVRRNGMAACSLLDDTRIHPESRGLAQELAKQVYLKDVQDETIDDDDEVLQMAIKHVRKKPHLLKSLTKRSKQKNNTQNLIRLELIHGFQDWRKPYAEPSQDEEFCMISGETEDSLAQGRIVQATIRRVLPSKAVCILHSGLVGTLAKEDFADNWKKLPLTKMLKEGDVVSCKIKLILKNQYELILTCKESEMRINQYENHQYLDPYYHKDPSSLPVDQDKVRTQKELGRKHLKPRMIVHPRFQNISADEAVEFLADKDIGESVVHPSSKGPPLLTLTLKVYDGIYAHQNILEGIKEHKNIASLLGTGKTLQIGEYTCEDLDEVIYRYVDPLVVNLKLMLNYRKFKKGTKAEVDELLRIEKAENPMRIVYCFGISHEHPTTCILTYIRSSNPHHEYVGVYPTGFKFRNEMFLEIDQLVAYFQRHFYDPQKSAPPIRPIAAMVQMGSAATGGQAGGWDGSSDSGNGWGGQSSDQDQTFTPGSRAGSADFRNGGSQDGHLSGIPRPYGGRGRGWERGRGSYDGSGRRDGRSSDKQDFDSGIQSGGGGTGGWGGNGGAGDGTAGGWGGSGGNRGGGSSGGWGGSGVGWGGSGGSGGGNGGAWGGSGGDASGGGSGGDTGGGSGWRGGGGGSGGTTRGFVGIDSGGGRGRGRDGRGRVRGADGESGGSSWGGRRGGGGNRGRRGGGRVWGARGGSYDVESGGSGGSWGGSSGNGGGSGGWGGGSNSSWGNGGGGDEGGGGSGSWGVGKGNEGGGGGSGWGSGSNGSWGATGNGGGGDKGAGGSGGWGADKGKGGGSGTGGWGSGSVKGKGGGSGTGGWGSGSVKGKEGGGGGSGWGSGNNSNWGATGIGGGDDTGGGGSGGWGAGKGKGGGSGGWGADKGKGGGRDDGGGNGNGGWGSCSNGGWGGGNAGSGTSKDVPKSGGSGSGWW